jgi:hypothetical protein
MRELWEHVPNGLKHLLDVISVTTVVGVLAQMLPHIAALLTIIWTSIRIHETRTVQRWLGKSK